MRTPVCDGDSGDCGGGADYTYVSVMFSDVIRSKDCM